MMHTSDRKDDLLTAFILSLCCYALLVVMVLFQPASQAMWDRALGPAPYGVEQHLFIILWITAVCLPLPYGFFHAVKTARLTKREMSKKSPREHVADHAVPFLSVLNYIRHLLSNEDVPPALKKSKLATLGLIVYLIAVTAGWIAWAEAKGI